MRNRPDTRAVFMLDTVSENGAKNVVVLLHKSVVRLGRRDVRKGSAFRLRSVALSRN
jgi:hypothetical protein